MATPPNPHPHPLPEEEDYDAEELTPGTTHASSHTGDGKSAERRTNSSRSKHSETEQRRRSKINERFQILKDLIPPNDQKRDKASLLLEVIEYIQFLQEKIQFYEGSCQSWNQEPAKLMPWRNNHGHEEGYSNHSQIMKYGFGHDNNVIQPIANVQSTFESDFGDDPAYRVPDHVTEPISDMPPNMSSLPATIYSSGPSILPAENLVSQSESQFWHDGSSAAECNDIRGNRMSEQDRAHEGILSNTSNAYSQRLLKSLTKALQTAGVNLSPDNISVQLDVGKHQNSNHTLLSSVQGHPGNGSSTSQHLMHYREGNDSSQPAKRFRTEESYLDTEKQIQLR